MGFCVSNSIEAGLSSINKMCKGKPVATLHADAFFGTFKVTTYQNDMVILQSTGLCDPIFVISVSGQRENSRVPDEATLLRDLICDFETGRYNRNHKHLITVGISQEGRHSALTATCVGSNPTCPVWQYIFHKENVTRRMANER